MARFITINASSLPSHKVPMDDVEKALGYPKTLLCLSTGRTIKGQGLSQPDLSFRSAISGSPKAWPDITSHARPVTGLDVISPSFLRTIDVKQPDYGSYCVNYVPAQVHHVSNNAFSDSVVRAKTIGGRYLQITDMYHQTSTKRSHANDESATFLSACALQHRVRIHQSRVLHRQIIARIRVACSIMLTFLLQPFRE